MQLRHFGVLLLLGAIWGASFLLIKIALREIPTATLVAIRLVVGASFLVTVLYSQGLRLPSTSKVWRDFTIVGVLGVVFPFLLITWSQEIIPSGLAAILNSTVPLFTVLLVSVWTRDDKLTWIQLMGVAIGFLGVVVAVGVTDLSFGSGEVVAYLAVLAASLAYAIVNIYGRRAFRGMRAFIPAAGLNVTAALVITPIALTIDGVPTKVPSLLALGAALTLAVVATGVAYILFYWLLERIGATRTGMVTYLIAPFALLYGALLLNETITLNTILGLLLVIVGVGLTSNIFRLRFWG